MYPTYPKVVVYAAHEPDIWHCLHFARSHDLTTVVRAGGHSMAGYSVCEGLVIDVSGLNRVTVDTESSTAVVQAGTKIYELEAALEAEGFHVPGGGCPTVAVAGYMMGGGYGFTSRYFGLNCDNVLSARVMLADGTIVRASAEENGDLFWALRGGGGGNFGVLLDITYRVHGLGKLHGLRLEWSLQRTMQRREAAAALFLIQERFLPSHAYPQLGMQLLIQTDPDGGGKKLIACLTWVGQRSGLDEAVAPLLALPGTNVTLSLHAGYSEVNARLLSKMEAIPPGIRAYCCSHYVDQALDLPQMEALLDFYVASVPNAFAIVAMECYGGKINTVPSDATAFYHREALFDIFAFGFFTDEPEEQQSLAHNWIAQLNDFLQPIGNGHAYQNYPSRELPNHAWAYWGPNYPQLQRIKRKYDPDQFFRYGQAIDGRGATERTTSPLYTGP
ncbi:FAD/FMN-containing dehydrogenase [Lewinella marina]|uniref:FAD-binding oxidoreductase n=1 Tax=Neolewinella marina TaxID=438751 RepID=UPI00142F8548|nr:FAD-binding oxidoreductase [Neolewinella marina]NJB85352.1 FAD/FMN-containing dehydrogenase [Neolewinella marina]